MFFVIKLGFLSTLYPNFDFIGPVFFPCDFFIICFLSKRPHLVLETKHFASKQNSWFVSSCGKSDFRVLCVSLGGIFGTKKFHQKCPFPYLKYFTFLYLRGRRLGQVSLVSLIKNRNKTGTSQVGAPLKAEKARSFHEILWTI